MKNVTMIAAVGKNLELGKDNDLIWRFKEDMSFFRKHTIHKPIILGRKTLDSLPGLLPERQHIVLTRSLEQFPDSVLVMHSIEELLPYIEQHEEEFMVIGGASVYRQMLPYADTMLLTEVDAESDADVYFPAFKEKDWNSTILSKQEEKGISYKHLVYTRKK